MDKPLDPSVPPEKTESPSPVTNDSLWYKDAVIYQLHVKSFYDSGHSGDDGVGDFEGLISKLDYIAELGVNVIWLLPFYPSPRRDDGYDISDYCGVHPEYGTVDDVRRFIEEAHSRGIRVITELVINHTSDQHPWFQRARHAPPGSPERDFYVWSDTDKAYAGTRIIFLDTEKSNWTWDEEAKAYYWHRFYSHQPDLNFDNPAGAGRVPGRAALLAGHGRRWAQARRRPLSRRARRHQQRKPPRDARHSQTHSRRGRRPLHGPRASRRGQPVARRRPTIFRRRRRMPHAVPLSL